MIRFLVVVIAVSALVVVAAPVAAQDQDRPLSEVIPDLYLDAFLEQYIAFITALPPGFFDEDVLFDDLLERLGFVRQVIGLAGNQLTSFPLASPLSRQDPSLGWILSIRALEQHRASGTW